MIGDLGIGAGKLELVTRHWPLAQRRSAADLTLWPLIARSFQCGTVELPFGNHNQRSDSRFCSVLCCAVLWCCGKPRYGLCVRARRTMHEMLFADCWLMGFIIWLCVVVVAFDVTRRDMRTEMRASVISIWPCSLASWGGQ